MCEADFQSHVFLHIVSSHPVHVGSLWFPPATAVSSHEARGALFCGAAEPKNGMQQRATF